jgi:Glycine-zipper domain
LSPLRRNVDVRVGVLMLAALVSGCATIPTGPSVMVLPGTGKAFEQFQVDDTSCRQWALQQCGMAPGDAATSSGVTSAVVGTVLGAGLGAAIGAAAGNPALGAAVGAGAGLFGGSVIGADAAIASGSAVQYRYDVAYKQCMYAKGNQIPVAARMVRGARPAYATSATVPPPPPPPPTYAPPPPPPASAPPAPAPPASAPLPPPPPSAR